ncbi:MAG: CbiQ family ECF transporter T component [Kineosporiaceae bacterium]
MIGLYVAGDSPVHRAPAALKLGGLAVLLLAVGFASSGWVLLVAAVVVVAVAALSGVGARAVAAQVRPLLWVLAPLVAVQVWVAGPAAAVRVAGALSLAVAAAGLVTLTTRTEELLDVLTSLLRPLRRLGVDPDRVALVLALAVRSVPVLAGLAAEVREARAARGAERSIRAFAVPFVIRSLRHADRLGEALAARGVDD